MDRVYDTLDKYWALAIAVAVGCASILLTRDVLLREFERGPLHSVTVIAALASTLFIFVLYINATREELELAKTHKYIELVGQLETEQVILIFAVALCFGGLIAFVTNLLVYTALMIGLQVFDLVGAYVVRRRFQGAEKKKNVDIPGRAILHEYYVLKPHLILRSVRLIGCTIALVLAIVARRSNSAVLTALGWAAMMCAILSSEYVLHLWRKVRRQRLKPKHF
jgi:hypothetical protein